ncbi:glycosyltransferase family 4 protein [Patescibacteria group bacterium]|nr:glycosyltransferase family 4 protein [Patescibacteria group bacterium]
MSGARVRCYNFASALRKYGIDAEVFSFADNLGAKYGEKEYEMSFSDKIRYNIQAFKALLKKDKDSIFFIQRLNYHAIAPLLVSLLKKHRLIFDCDDWNISEYSMEYFGFFPSSKMEYFTRKISGRADACIAASAFLKDYLRRFNKKIYYIPTGVDTSFFEPKNNHSNGSKIIFSWIGTVYHYDMYENIKFVLRCFSEIADRHDNVFMHLAGEGKYFRELKKEAHKIKNRNRIAMNDWVHPDKIPDYLASIDIGLLPLIQETRFNKAKSPTKLFEYMAMAKPTVSTNIGEAKTIITDGKDGFLAKTREEVIKKMDRLVEDAELRRKMGVNARDTVEKYYSLDVAGRRLYEILNQLKR